MKYTVFFVMSLSVMITGCAVFGRRPAERVQSEQIKSSGVFEGNAMGYRGPIHVQVRITGGSITEITVIDSMEDRFIGGAAMEELIDLAVEYNSTDIDVISGATVTSRGFLEAVNNAIMQK